MEQKEGIHFYIDVLNLNEVVVEEESKTRSVTHSIHALDTLFTSIERYAKSKSESLTVEKVTGSRLHMYIIGEYCSSFDVVMDVSVYAYEVCDYLNHDYSKYKTLKDFSIRLGAASGKFYEFEYDFKVKGKEPELTTIGFAANYAAKLQVLTKPMKISISDDLYDELRVNQRLNFMYVNDEGVRKYGKDGFYAASLAVLGQNYSVSEAELERVRHYANTVALRDINFKSVRQTLSFDRLNRTTVKKLEGIPLYVDVRGFTAQFDSDDGNLNEMAVKTQQILEALYSITIAHNGVHVQFQGDRELALFHNVPSERRNGFLVPEQKCYKDAVLTAMRMIDRVKGLGLHVGVGEAFGTLYATKIGARGEKDNILIGHTVIEADIMEDAHAGEDQIAITPEVYAGLCDEDRGLARQFRRNNDYYLTTIGYNQYLRNVSSAYQRINTSRANYNGAWGGCM